MTVPAKYHIMDDPTAAQLSRAVIYTRYSSHAQRDVSIEQQLKACKVFAERQGIEIVGTYEDRALTGTSDRRPGFQKMIRDAERGDWDYVIVYTLDRFARDRYDSAVYKRQLKACGVKVLSAMENISDDPTGVLMESLLEGLAEYYSKELSRKITRGMDDNASKCMVNGLLPLGYVRGENGQYAIDETEAALVREIYRRVDEGELQSRIIADLNLRGLRTKVKKPWTRSSLERILCNERYTGIYIYKDMRIPGGIPQIIDQELFDAVQHKLHTKNNPRSTSPQRRRRDASVYLLTGKLYCGHCKGPMIGVSGKSQAATPYYYYVCKEKRSNHTCDKKAVRREKIEYSIAAALKNTMLTDKAITVLADAAVAYQRKNMENSDLSFLRDRLTEINASIKNIVSAIEAGIFSAATQKRLTELEAEQLAVTRQLTTAEKEAENNLTREDIITALRTFQNGDLNDKDYQEALIDTFLVAAYLYDNEIKIVFNLGGEKNETAIPFDIDDISLSESEDVRITSASVHHICLTLLRCETFLTYSYLNGTINMTNNKIAVLGGGTMGLGIAVTYALGGYSTSVYSRSQKTIDRAKAVIESNLQLLREEDMITSEAADAALARIRYTNSVAEAVEGAWYVTETIVEQADAKKALYTELDTLLPADVIIASNTSYLDIFSIMPQRRLPYSVISHWYAPAHILPLVEIVKGEQTLPSVMDAVMTLHKACGKTAVRMEKYIPGFIVNRVQSAMTREVMYLIENGYCTPEELDLAVKTSLMPRGLLLGLVQRMDFTGLDMMANSLTNKKYSPAPEVDRPHIVFDHVARGEYGVKSGKGIYDYANMPYEEVLRQRDRMLLKSVALAGEFMDTPLDNK